MSEPIRITVFFDLQRCSPNRRLHHMAKARETRAAREAARCAWVLAGSPRLEGRARVGVVVRRARVLDQANIWSACKGALDGIFVGGVTPDDGPAWLELGSVRQEVGSHWKGAEEVVFVIEPACPHAQGFVWDDSEALYYCPDCGEAEPAKRGRKKATP